MIIEALMSLIKTILNILMTPINIPELPENVLGYIDQLLNYISTGLGLLSYYFHLDYILTLFFVIVGVEVGIKIYYLIMWILKKIPMLGIK